MSQTWWKEKQTFKRSNLCKPQTASGSSERRSVPRGWAPWCQLWLLAHRRVRWFVFPSDFPAWSDCVEHRAQHCRVRPCVCPAEKREGPTVLLRSALEHRGRCPPWPPAPALLEKLPRFAFKKGQNQLNKSMAVWCNVSVQFRLIVHLQCKDYICALLSRSYRLCLKRNYNNANNNYNANNANNSNTCLTFTLLKSPEKDCQQKWWGKDKPGCRSMYWCEAHDS